MTTRTLHVPTAVPRTALPTNLQRVVPDVMLMRMVPCDLRGMVRPAAAAMRAAVNNLVRLTVRVRGPVVAETALGSGDAETVVVDWVVAAFPVGDVVATCCNGVAGDVDVDVEVDVEVELDVVVVETVIETTVAAADLSVWSFTPS